MTQLKLLQYGQPGWWGHATISFPFLALSLGTPETNRTFATVSTRDHGRFNQVSRLVYTAVSS